MAFIKGKQIKDASVLTTKLSGISSTPDAGDILVTGASGVLAAVTVSGDATLASNGTLTIASGAIQTAMINADVITGQTAETSAHDDDLILIYDDSASALRKMTRANFTAGLGGGGGSSAADDITTGDAAVTIATSSGNITIDAQASDSDIIFKGTDGVSDITMLTLDGSEAGAASFNSAVTVGGDLNVNGDTTTFASANTTDPLVIIKNTTNDANGARLRLVKDKGAAGADNDVAGLIEFYADDDNQDNILFAEIKAQVADASNGAEGGKLSLSIATHDGESQPGLVLVDGDAEDEVDVTVANGSSSNTTVSGNLIVTSNLTVNGTTTTVNSTTITVDDPIFTLGGDTAPGSDDNKDRGIEFRWHNGSAAKVGFFGFDDSTGRFSFIPDATNNSEVFSGTLGDIDINALYIGGTSMVTSDGAAKVQSGVAGVGLAHSGGVLSLNFSELTTYNAGGDTLAAGDLICVYDVSDSASQSVTFQEMGQKIAGGSGLAWSTLSTNMYVQTNGSSVQANSSGIRVGIFQKDDLGQTVSSNVTADNTDTGLDITNTPHADQIVRVEVNGVAVELGDGVKTKTCYFSGDSGSNARAMGDIAAGDSLYWNGSSVYSLETDDIVDFIYSSL